MPAYQYNPMLPTQNTSPDTNALVPMVSLFYCLHNHICI
jgi:hypothetical protein